MSPWKKEQHAEYAAVIGNRKFGYVTYRDGLRVCIARGALAEIERLQARVAELEQIIKDSNPYPMAKPDGSVGVTEPPPGFVSVTATKMPDCGSPGPCPCSEAHAGSDGACTAPRSPADTSSVARVHERIADDPYSGGALK